MQIKILQEGTYNNAAGRAAKYLSGDVLDTKNWYAEELINNGLAGYMVEIPDNKPKAKILGNVVAPKVEVVEVVVEEVEQLPSYNVGPIEEKAVERFEEIKREKESGRGRKDG